MERALGRWWNNPQLAQKIGINTDQIKKMDDIFQQHRLKLVDLNANLQKAEFTLEPLMSADQPDEARIVAQIDRVAQARAELEKANARMLLGIRQVLTPDQWKKLQEEQPAAGRGGMGGGQGGMPPRPAGR
jgi:Spy/CpxP family protein refolding chaperone